MKYVIFALMLVVTAGCVSMAAPRDISGQWFLKLARDPEMGNDGVPSECTVRQRGMDLVVRCGTSRDEFRGELQGRKVVLRVEKTGIPPVTADRMVVTLTGEMNEFDTSIKGVFTIVSSVIDHKKVNFEMWKKQ
jgi:hypothetical protein